MFCQSKLMKVKLIIASIICVLMLSFFSSCQSREEKVINRLEKLSRNIEKNANGFTSEEWDNTFKEMDAIDDAMEKCRFSESQLARVGRLKGRLTAIIFKKKIKSFEADMATQLKEWSSYCEGFMQGITSDCPDDFQDGD